MTKEQELMRYLHKKVFDPILDSPDAPSNIKSGVNLTIARMSRLSAEKMVQYFWSALARFSRSSIILPIIFSSSLI
jgi:hypothetical protein